MRAMLAAALVTGLPGTIALADPPPPDGAKPLTELLRSIENSDDFGYFDEVEWDDGAYETEYHTNTGTKKKIYIDPTSGEQRPDPG